jgi:hypothetical protein
LSHQVRASLSGGVWRLAATLALIGSLACHRAKAQQTLQITIRQKSIELAVQDTLTLYAVVIVTPSQEALMSVNWSSDNSAIADVDQKGVVTARAPGVTGITARVGSAFATTRVTVSASAVRRDKPAVETRPFPTSARSGSASSTRSAKSPHFSHISLFYTDFYTRYASPADKAATLAFLGARVDGVMSGARDDWRGADPTVLHFPYALQYTVPIQGQKGAPDEIASGFFADMQRWYAAHPKLDFESAFLHRGGHDAAHRVQVKIWDSMRYAINPGDEGQRAYQMDRLKRVAQHESGVFLDEFGGSLNGVAKASDEFATPDAYFAAETKLISQVHDAIKPAFLLINVGAYWTPTDSALAVAGGGAHLEGANWPFTDRLHERWKQIDDLLALNVYVEFVSLWSYTDWAKSHTYPSFGGGMYASPLERGQLVQLASYYMAVPANPARLSFDQQNKWNVRPDTAWMPAVEADVGHPREARHVIASGEDKAAQRYQIFARDFDHAYVVLRAQVGWKPESYADSTGVAVPLPAPMRPLHRDGSLGAAVSSITLRQVEAAILFK